MENVLKVLLSVLFICISLLAAGCGGGGANQPAVAKTLLAPTGVIATGGINKVTLAWKPVPGADSYNIYWSRNPRVTKATGIKITGAKSPYQHVGLFVSSTYFYVVTAVSSAGESVVSNQTSTVSAHDGANLYIKHCAKCHGPVTATTIKNGLPGLIKEAIDKNSGGMGVLSTLTKEKINIISEQLPCH
jgi:cytochrome c553